MRGLGVRLLLGTVLASTPMACGDEPGRTNEPPTPELCTTDDECDAGRCDPRQGCVDCLFDHDCEGGERCEQRVCREVTPCESEDDCGGANYPVCDLGAGECVACLTDDDCGGTAHCVERRCEAYEACTADDDCAEGVCDSSAGECVECVESTDCGGESACVGERCVTPCARESDCPSEAPICGPAGYCVECAVHTHCPDVYHCVEGGCAIDVCENSETRCQADTLGIETCASSGNGFVGSACDARQSCTDTSGEPECVDWSCEPNSQRCDTDSTHLERCSADGLKIAERTNCADQGEVCAEGACVAPVCEPGELSCEDSDLYRCSDDGTARELEQTCALDELCDAADGACIPLICPASLLVCDGDTVRTCNENGTGYSGEAIACDEAASCFDGACLPRICVGTYLCDGDASRLCADAGTRLELVETCSLDAVEPNYCNPDTGRCELVGCEPSQPICSGNFATVCADDGSAPVAGGIDCEAIGEVCFNGACLPELCTEEYVCRQGDLYHCEDNGSALRLSGECGRPELCDAVAGLCLPEVCTPGDPICNDTIATLCDETGAGYEPGGTDCADSGKACSEGACAPIVCNASQYVCIEGDVHLCNQAGTESELVAECGTGEHCEVGASSCQPNACSPGAAVCIGSVATTCRPDGSGPAEGGTDCADTSEACRLGECEPLVCAPSERFCEAGHVRICNGSGTASAPYEDCAAGEYCDTGPATCRPLRCTPNGAACSGETLAICNEDGSGYASLGTDCAASGNVCDLVSGCSASAVDIVGGAEFSSQNPMPTLHLSVLEVLTPRTLTEIRSYFAVTAETEIVWVVYEGLEIGGPFDKVFEVAGTVTAGTATFHASGNANVPLEAGNLYALGVLVRGTHIEYQHATVAEPISFAAVVGASRITTTDVVEEMWMEVSASTIGLYEVVTE